MSNKNKPKRVAELKITVKLPFSTIALARIRNLVTTMVELMLNDNVSVSEWKYAEMM